MRIKECSARVKAAADGGQGEFSALVSVFGNKDDVGDVVIPGAFTESLAEWKASGNPIPVIWSHDWSDPFSHIGAVTDAKETEQGLEVTAQLDLDNPKAEQVYRLLKGGRVTQFSFAYDVEEGAWIEKDDNGVHDAYYELRKVKVYEVGPTLVGANQETDLLGVKASALLSSVKEGRVLAQKHLDSLREAHSTIGAVIEAADKTSPSEDGKGAEKASAKQDDGHAATPPAPSSGTAETATPESGEAMPGTASLDLMALTIAIRQRGPA